MEVAIFLLLLSSSIHFTSSTTSSTSLGNDTDMISLLAFKSLITQGPSAAMSSWNETNHFCNWNGVTCSKNKRHPDRVTSLDLSSSGVAGFISPSIANLTFLRNLDLADNGLHGTIPPGIGKLRRLQLLNLSYNSFHGLIPINLTYCSDLTILDLISNTLSGKIPIEFGSLTKLGFLGLSNNILTGSLPSSVGNLSSLYHIALRANQLEGSIPHEFGRLHSLQYFRASDNKLSAAAGAHKAASSSTSLNTWKLAEETKNLSYERVPTELKKSIMQARMDKKYTQAQLALLISEKPQVIQE